MKIVPLDAIATPRVHRSLYPDGDAVEESYRDYYTRFCVWAEGSGFTAAEYLLPQILIENDVTPMLFEQRFSVSTEKPPTRAEIDDYAPWFYYIEWKEISTTTKVLSIDPLHRYRSSLFRELTKDLLGEERSRLTAMDVACSSGVLTLDLAEHGFKHVLGLELRDWSIAQANFLKKTFQISNVDFKVEDARNVGNYSADVVFCGGLLYHVIFPVQLVESLFKATGKFLILDSLCNNHPFSGFHLVDDVDIESPLEGDTAIQLIPTYRAIIALLRNAGFETIYEVLGRAAPQVPFYSTLSIRSFLAVKPGVELPALEAGKLYR